MKVRVTHHGYCHHESRSWNLAFAEAMAHAKVEVSPRSRQSTIRALMSEGARGIWHQGVHFVGKVVS